MIAEARYPAVVKNLRLTRLISGGQTGADQQGALLAARELGIPTGGTAPKGWLTETGPQELLLKSFGLIECADPGYAARTEANVLGSDRKQIGLTMKSRCCARIIHLHARVDIRSGDLCHRALRQYSRLKLNVRTIVPFHGARTTAAVMESSDFGNLNDSLRFATGQICATDIV